MRRKLSVIAVYCGSSPGLDPLYAEVAGHLGKILAERGIGLVYGGGHVGLMGALADAALEGGGKAHGVITKALEDKEVAHKKLTSIDVVSSMHERKMVMANLADAFIMMPGGFGTLEEFLEVATWTQLGVHSKPCGILNVNGYFDPLIKFLDNAVQQRFLRFEHLGQVVIATEPADLVAQLDTWEPKVIDKWLDRSDHQF